MRSNQKDDDDHCIESCHYLKEVSLNKRTKKFGTMYKMGVGYIFFFKNVSNFSLGILESHGEVPFSKRLLFDVILINAVTFPNSVLQH